MGWASAGYIFDPVARALIEANASDELKRTTLSALIKQLQAGDWDTEGESLGEFADDAAIVQAFRDNNVIIECFDDNGPEGTYECTKERGHGGDHRDELSKSWPQAGSGVVRWYRKELPSKAVLAIGVEDPPTDDAPYTYRVGLDEMGLDKDDLWATWALLGAVLGDEIPPDWAVGPIPATDVNGDPIEVKRDV